MKLRLKKRNKKTLKMSNEYRIGIIAPLDYRSALNDALIHALREDLILINSEANYFAPTDIAIKPQGLILPDFPEPKINCKKGHTYLPPEYKCRCGKELGSVKHGRR